MYWLGNCIPSNIGTNILICQYGLLALVLSIFMHDNLLHCHSLRHVWINPNVDENLSVLVIERYKVLKRYVRSKARICFKNYLEF